MAVYIKKMDKLFQKICNLFPHYKLDNKIKRKIFYLIFSLFKFFLRGPFILNFKYFKFYSYPQKGHYSRFLLTRGVMPDDGEIGFINKNIDEDTIFFDCGANQGFYSIPIASINRFIQVHAFEPSEKEYKLLKDNLELNKLSDILVNKKAVSSTNKDLLFEDKNKENFDTIGGVIVFDNNNENTTKRIQSVTLDKYTEDLNINKKKNILIKIDIEGHDIDAIYGSEYILNNFFCIIIFEFSRLILDNKNFNPDDFQKFLDIHNLMIIDLHKKEFFVSQLMDKISKLDKNHLTLGNYILIKKKNLNLLKT